ncbi:MAG: YbeD family protein [Syntrophales bacterium]
MNEGPRKPVIEYPCQWVYKVIGPDEAALREAVTQVVQDLPHTVAISNTSATGRYCCLNVELTVADEEIRTSLYEMLKDHPAVRIVL